MRYSLAQRQGCPEGDRDHRTIVLIVCASAVPTFGA
jgi:hypothetical protein